MLASLGLWVIPAVYALCFGGLSYVLFKALREASESYADEYTQDTAREFEDIFLFIPATRLLEIARIAAVTIFLLFFFLVGDVSTPGGILQGLVAGALMGTLVLFAPRVIVRILRRRRLERFNEQLVDGLTTMSNALRAGFSILQAFEAVVKEGRNPISQEFGMFLQQVRVGVNFEDALQEMDRRVGSEDLSLMLLSIETARRTGGNLTEVFDKIASTIRERMRIKGRIKSLTAQGRLQGIVVGAMPFLLLGVLIMLDPKMTADFFTSVSGIIALIAVTIMVALGGLIIRKIVRIDI